MKGPEFLALIFSVSAFLGIFYNYNVVYAQLNKTRPWYLTRKNSDVFYMAHRKLGWTAYPVRFVWSTVWIILFAEKGFWLASVLIALYLVTRVPAWFVLGPRTAFLERHKAMQQIGPSGKIEPLPGHHDTYVASP